MLFSNVEFTSKCAINFCPDIYTRKAVNRSNTPYSKSIESTTYHHYKRQPGRAALLATTFTTCRTCNVTMALHHTNINQQVSFKPRFGPIARLSSLLSFRPSSSSSNGRYCRTIVGISIYSHFQLWESIREHAYFPVSTEGQSTSQTVVYPST